MKSTLPGAIPAGLARTFARKINRNEPQMRIDKHIAIIVATTIVCATAIIWGVFIWPTPYKYEKVTRPWYSGTKQEVYRINRFTGHSEKVVDPIPKTTDD